MICQLLSQFKTSDRLAQRQVIGFIHVGSNLWTSFFWKKRRSGGEGRDKGKGRKKKEEACIAASSQHVPPSMQSENTDQSAALFTQQLSCKILPQFVQDGIMCEQNHGYGDLHSESNQVFFSFLLL